jgi:DNA-binding protein HU-beta
MNQAELATQIAKTTGLSKAKAESALRATLRVISVEVEKGETVKLVGFGTFKRTARSARTGFNPQTKKSIKIPARSVPKFVPGKEFKELIDSGKKTRMSPVAKKAKTPAKAIAKVKTTIGKGVVRTLTTKTKTPAAKAKAPKSSKSPLASAIKKPQTSAKVQKISKAR